MEKPKNLLLVIFGASGDLAHKKLLPSLYSLNIQHLLPERFAILGVGRTVMTTDDFRANMKKGILDFSEEKELNEEQINAFLGCLNYIPIDMGSAGEYVKLKSLLTVTDQQYDTGGNYLFYLATPPSMFEVISSNLRSVSLNHQNAGYKRIIIEKPFGYDLESGRELNRKLHCIFKEDQIYRIDHYLGKETVQNLLVTRFANGIFEPLWNRNYIHHVEITSAESIGVEGRGRYYDSAGALRDMLQNHLMQMVALTAMEPPSSMDSDSIRNEMVKVFQSLRPIEEDEVEKFVIRGQYTASKVRGESITAYRDERGVTSDSRTETYVAMKFFIDNWRWGDVPFYIRTGKRLPTRVTEIVIHFKPTPHYLFMHDDPFSLSNQLVVRIQPDEGILLKFGMKYPGEGYTVKNVNMDFHYKDLGEVRVPSAYERLLYDVMLGDSTLYLRADAVEAAWKFVAPVQQAWERNPGIKIYGYPAGTWGPEIADDLIEEKEMTWHYPCKNLADDGLYCEL
jgi:glucose-6-phosphate 1-dehydrogenase